MASTNKLLEEHGLTQAGLKNADNPRESRSLPVQVPAYGKYVGVRAALNNMGFDNSRIGYNGQSGTVTLDGKELLKPGYLDDEAGVSYAAPEQIQAGVASLFSGGKNPVVRVSDAYAELAGKYGLSADALGYSNGSASIGGVPVDTLYTDSDGKSWAFQDAVRQGVERYAASLGVQSPNELRERYESAYLPGIQTQLSALAEREPFSYDPDSDPVYQAYRKKYALEGNRAAEHSMAGYLGLTGGYANSAAATAGAQAQQYYAQQLTNVIPELARQAYGRYTDQFNEDLGVAKQMLNVYQTAYGNAAAANADTLKNANAAIVSNSARDQAAYKKYWDTLFQKQEYEWTKDKNNNDFWWTQIFNQQKKDQNDQDYESSRLENEELLRYLRDYYDSLMQNQLEGGGLDNSIKRETIQNLRTQRALMR